MASQYVEFGLRFRLSADADGALVSFQRLVDVTRESVANLKVMSGSIAFAGTEGATAIPFGDIAEAYFLFLAATVDGYLVAWDNTGGEGTPSGFPLKKRLGGDAFAQLMTAITAGTLTVDPGGAGDLYYCIAGV